MKARVAWIFSTLSFALVACRAPRAIGSGARVDPGPYQGTIEEWVGKLEPKVVEVLKTRWEWQYRIRADPGYQRHPAETRVFDRRVTLGASALVPEHLAYTLAHELAHVHMVGVWRELPPVLQEGVAEWVALTVLDLKERFDPMPPEAGLLLQVLSMPYPEYKFGPIEKTLELERAATWLALQMFETPRWEVIENDEETGKRVIRLRYGAKFPLAEPEAEESPPPR